ncbi:MAG: hypothetical protein P8J50_01955 [Acidimicrobiales bacterium]|nr:hypothetical protein [Acidimicrobiales bacterium]
MSSAAAASDVGGSEDLEGALEHGSAVWEQRVSWVTDPMGFVDGQGVVAARDIDHLALVCN